MGPASRLWPFHQPAGPQDSPRQKRELGPQDSPEDTCDRTLSALLTPMHTRFVPADLLNAVVKATTRASPSIL